MAVDLIGQKRSKTEWEKMSFSYHRGLSTEAGTKTKIGEIEVKILAGTRSLMNWKKSGRMAVRHTAP
jgi:hypothetical protein